MIDDVIWKNKEIRNFLSNYKQEDGAKVIRSALLLGIELIKRESTQPILTPQSLEQFTINILSTSKCPPSEPAGLEKRPSSVPSKLRGFTLKHDSSWRKGDDA